jgi:hypothetical protein
MRLLMSGKKRKALKYGVTPARCENLSRTGPDCRHSRSVGY